LEPFEESSDEDLVELLVGQDATAEQAFAVLEARHAGVSYRLARSIVLDQHRAEDVVQEAWTKLYLKAGTFDRRDGTFGGWFASIVRNTARDSLRHWARRPEHPQAPELLVLDEMTLPDDADLRVLYGDLVEHCVEVLMGGSGATTLEALKPLAYAFVVVDVEQNDPQTFARALGGTERDITRRYNRLKTNLSRARKTLREHFECCSRCEDVR
jgi:RNA polymerase sigma factor (sigma-70 family)